MVEVKNIRVYDMHRAIRSISNSYTIGEIDTAGIYDASDLGSDISEKKYLVAKTLGSNTDPHQSHDAYLKGIRVSMDIKYPQYWTPEFQRYKFVDIIMSQSTMHSLEKFLSGDIDPFNKYVCQESKDLVKKLYNEWTAAKDELKGLSKDDSKYNDCSDKVYDKFIQLRSNLPSGFEMWETVDTNYLQLKTIWVQRHNHPLKEDWGAFCSMIENLPNFKELALNKLLGDK